ncbi:hypothetical protein CXB49_12440 [Chromobacterium sp. ATCC 53434]|uniref:carbamoyltransferase family protein n=1 Tax=Chromobacterium TaxID=535 RepID=UPI000C790A37|nr:carbamoyltransferase N-terminal domain-containing protein [Chromobacterium sp. ATCC 53434]AUH51569.1 hypothetical protein CXB49_12440 [Chromobacterium sp. ATCC 53434]
MNIVGLSFDFHDGSAALVSDGELLGVAAEERFTLQKHDSNYPAQALSALMRQHSLDQSQIDQVVYYERPSTKYSRILSTSLSQFPSGIRNFISANKSWLKEKLWVRSSLSARFNLPLSKIHLMEHHHSHIAQAFFASPFESAAVLIVDGIGEWDCTTLATASRNGPEKYKVIEQFQYPHSIGLVYAAFTAYLGFKPNSAEASTMALAAFGRPIYTERIKGILNPRQDGSYHVDASYFNFEGNANEIFTSRLVEVFGPPRDIRIPYPFDSLAEQQENVSADDQRCADIAASLQEVLAEVLLGLARLLRAQTGQQNLCFAGGVALNCLANSRLARESGFDGLFIPPDPGDGGAAYGTAFLYAAEHGPVRPITHPYLGCSWGSDVVRPLLAADGAMDFLVGRQNPGVRAAESIRRSEYHDEDALAADIAEMLCSGAIVAWVQGRFELGPRALGNRSLLVDPSNLAAVRRMSHQVKSHVHFRPYALSLAAEDADKIFQLPGNSVLPIKWMQTIWEVDQRCYDSLRGAIHVDGTTRPQICAREDNPRYWKLLTAIGRHSGLAAILNTSLNERSFPMVGHPHLALAMFARTGIDVLVLDNMVFRKAYSGDRQ